MKGDAKTSKPNIIFSYFQESYLELRKVTWPTRNQAIKLTFLVLGFCLVAAAVVGALDLVFNLGYRELVTLAPATEVTTDASATPAASTSQPITVTPTDVTTTPASTTATPSATTPSTSAQGVTVTPISGGTVTVGGTQQ